MMKNQSSSFSVMLFLVLFVSITMSLISLSMAGRPIEQASSSSSPVSPPEKVYVVLTRGEKSESRYISILSYVVGSREAARNSLVLAYGDVVNGFVAKLTSAQALALKAHRDVVQVIEDKNVRRRAV